VAHLVQSWPAAQATPVVPWLPYPIDALVFGDARACAALTGHHMWSNSDNLHVIKGGIMTRMSATIEKHHQKIIAGLLFVILFFVTACTFHDIIPVCHYLFGCDHAMH
jgi:hypothetical protein